MNNPSTLPSPALTDAAGGNNTEIDETELDDLLNQVDTALSNLESQNKSGDQPGEKFIPTIYLLRSLMTDLFCPREDNASAGDTTTTTTTTPADALDLNSAAKLKKLGIDLKTLLTTVARSSW